MREFLLKHFKLVLYLLLPLLSALLYYGLLLLINKSTGTMVGTPGSENNQEYVTGLIIVFEIICLWYLKKIATSELKIAQFLFHFLMFVFFNFLVLLSPWIFLIIAFNLNSKI